MSFPPRGLPHAGPPLTVAVVAPRSSLTRVVSVCALALLAAACPGDPQSQPGRGGETTPTADAARPVVGGVLRVTLAADVDSLDPHLAARPSSWWFARALHRGLYAFPDLPAPEGAQPEPDLAEAMPELSASGRVATVRLREGVRFSDEQLVTAGAVRASLQRLLGTGVGIAPYLVPRSEVRGGIERVDVIDDRTIRIRLAGPANDLVWLLAHPQAAIVRAGAPAPPARAGALAGAGPYRLATYRPERRIVLERNPAWDRERDQVRGAWVDRIDARVGVDRAEARADVATGTADLIVDPGPPDEPAGPTPTGARIVPAATTCTRYLFLDTRVSPLHRGRARLAIAHALDRRAFVADQTGTAAPRLLPPTVVGSASDEVLAEDLVRARELLADAGLNDGFVVDLLVGDSARDRRDSGRVATALARVGIRARVRTVPAATLYPLHYADPGERIAMGIATWCADWPGRAGRGVLMPLADPSRLGEQRVPARPGAGGATARRAVDAALRAPGADQIAARWAAADAAVVATGVLIPLSWTDEEVLLGSRVEGWKGSPMFPRGDPTGVWVGVGDGS